ncbi:unnamed protein product [Vicia faba]|uniref:Uncharacterized protein n=1 Tax=Vicia faba TaxID=3906 RepID=A0AAV0Z8W0_VICFA|nr:unnamed protein product [Vicia faba]
MYFGKLVIVGDEQAMLISHLSSFSYIDAEVVVGILFQTFFLLMISSLKDAQQVVQHGLIEGRGHIMNLPENKHFVGLGFSLKSGKTVKHEVIFRPIQEIFHSGGFIHPTSPEVDAVTKDDSDLDWPNFMTHGGTSQNWIVVDIPIVVHVSK